MTESTEQAEKPIDKTKLIKDCLKVLGSFRHSGIEIPDAELKAEGDKVKCRAGLRFNAPNNKSFYFQDIENNLEYSKYVAEALNQLRDILRVVNTDFENLQFDFGKDNDAFICRSMVGSNVKDRIARFEQVIEERFKVEAITFSGARIPK